MAESADLDEIRTALIRCYPPQDAINTNRPANEDEVIRAHENIRDLLRPLMLLRSLTTSTVPVTSSMDNFSMGHQAVIFLQEELESVIRVHESFISPVRKLPPEVLIRIFLHLHAQRKPEKRMFVALRLASVCRLWREIALDTEQLWSCISLIDFRRIRNELIQLYISRSKQAKLDVILHMVRRLLPPDLPTRKESFIFDYGEPLRTVVSVCDRWKSLEIKIQGDVPVPSFLDSYPAFLPHLERLSILLQRGESPLDQGWSTRFFARSQSLRSVDWQGWQLESDDAVSLPLGQLQTFITHDGRLLRNMILRCPNLTTAILPKDAASFPGEGHILHPTLEKLHLLSRKYHTFLHHATYPNLRELYVCEDPSVGDHPVSRTLHRFLRNSECRLTTLKVSLDLRGEHSSFERILCHHLPELQTLGVQECERTESFSTMLYMLGVPANIENVAVPMLKALEYEHQKASTNSDARFAEEWWDQLDGELSHVISSRRASAFTARMKSVKLLTSSLVFAPFTRVKAERALQSDLEMEFLLSTQTSFFSPMVY